MVEEVEEEEKSFNSLQTGKWILTYKSSGLLGADGKFQFPSNGKVDPNSMSHTTMARTGNLFQFPSNGKVDPNVNDGPMTQEDCHPFQFPSNGKVDPNEGGE